MALWASSAKGTAWLQKVLPTGWAKLVPKAVSSMAGALGIILDLVDAVNFYASGNMVSAAGAAVAAGLGAAALYLALSATAGPVGVGVALLASFAVSLLAKAYDKWGYKPGKTKAILVRLGLSRNDDGEYVLDPSILDTVVSES